MSHRGVEIVLGRLATDEVLRRRFSQAPARMLRELMEETGVELTAVELTALQKMDPWAIQRFAQSLDARLQKAALFAHVPDGSSDAEKDESPA